MRMQRFPLQVALIVLAGHALSAAEPDDPITPQKAVELFNGSDLTGWTTWLVDAKHDDPRGVYSVRDGAIRLSGDGFVNGKQVNEVHSVFPAAGKILLQCEGSEVFFRRLELHPLKTSQLQKASIR
jgi:hypothetical protein